MTNNATPNDRTANYEGKEIIRTPILYSTTLKESLNFANEKLKPEDGQLNVMHDIRPSGTQLVAHGAISEMPFQDAQLDEGLQNKGIAGTLLKD